MPGSSDDLPARARAGVLPPPSQAPDDAPDPVDVPRMEPPPPSLEAMVTSTGPLRRKPEPSPSSWWPWLLLALVAVTVAVYVLR